MEPPSSTTMLYAEDLTVRYGPVTAVDAVSIRAERGEILGLLGPNGAGKTSAIRALTTIVPISGGTAEVAGHRLADAASVRANIGVLPESNGYPGSQTGPAYLRYYGQLFGRTRTQAESGAQRLLAQMGLAGNNDRISTYSRGMRQRLGLARALINDPAVVFLDEPTLGLDPAGKEDILNQLTAAAIDRGVCVVLCSHLLDEVERVCDRVAIVDHGRIVADGTVDAVIDQAAIGARGRIRVLVDDIASASAVLDRTAAVVEVGFDNTRPGDINLVLAATDAAPTQVLRALLDAGIEPRSFDLHATRLSDAFLAITQPKAAP